MKTIRYGLIALWMIICSVISAEAGVSIGIGLPNVSIGINLPLYPELAPVPGYPVYYAPALDANYFFYDGMYWVYQDDNWYASSWYNGPWWVVEPAVVPLFVLRIPVRYYRQPPVYFRGWQSNAPPRWGQHWGHGWEQRRSGWDRWQRSSVPRRAPLPVYQRQYSGDRYPHVEQQHTLRSQHYRYQPRDTVVREHFKQQVGQKTSAPSEQRKKEEPAMRRPKQQDTPHPMPVQQGGAAAKRLPPPHQTPQKSEPAQLKKQPAPPQQKQQPPAVEQKKQSAPAQQRQQEPAVQKKRQPAPPQQKQQEPRLQGQEQRPQDKGGVQEPNRGHGQGQNKDDGRGRERNN